MTNARTRLDDLIQLCTFNMLDCNMTTDFRLLVSPVMGACYSFNFDSKYQAQRSGPLYGLRVLLNANYDEYLPTSAAGGMRILVHESTDFPLPDIHGFNVQTGASTSVGVNYVSFYVDRQLTED